MRTLEEKWKTLTGPTWTDADQVRCAAECKADLAELLLKSNPFDDENTEVLFMCLDALRGELIAWCGTKS
jgi:hypothetical protein